MTYQQDRQRELSLKRIASNHYKVVCNEGHSYGMLNAPQQDDLCCVRAMAEALVYEAERLTVALAQEASGS